MIHIKLENKYNHVKIKWQCVLIFQKLQVIKITLWKILDHVQNHYKIIK